jgi:hypothetical protein
MTDFGKRVDGVGGRRCAVREPVLLEAAITTLRASRRVAMVNVSESGARLRGDELPEAGQDIWLRAGSVDTLATVVWNHHPTCGITFDQAIDESQVEELRRAGRYTSLARLTPEERAAAEDWISGFAR